MGKFIFYCLLLVGAVYCAVTLHPAIFFGNNYAYKNMTLYTHDTLKEPPDKLLASVHDKIAADDLILAVVGAFHQHGRADRLDKLDRRVFGENHHLIDVGQ